ncbi:unnamed protein product [Polarella glacialis]|uniref:S-adenosylmethionine synthetase N-terminal domain-containing protein n=1 Tax=Polarella glacialis TaxID=89957 RepID=A0A813HR56_POLGL|nr:unnamed protein product [Polarella glacialis]
MAAEPAQKEAKTTRTFPFSSESVNEGHPDKICDQVSDVVVDASLREDPKSKVACETAAKDNTVMVADEITTQVPTLSAEMLGKCLNKDYGSLQGNCLKVRFSTLPSDSCKFCGASKHQVPWEYKEKRNQRGVQGAVCYSCTRACLVLKCGRNFLAIQRAGAVPIVKQRSRMFLALLKEQRCTCYACACERDFF